MLSLIIPGLIILLQIEQYALTEAGFVIAKLLQKYDRIENADTYSGGAMIDANLTMKHHNGVRVKLYSASSQKN